MSRRNVPEARTEKKKYVRRRIVEDEIGEEVMRRGILDGGKRRAGEERDGMRCVCVWR